MPVYNESFYYEIAFSFIDAEKQVDLFEEFIDKFSGISAKRFLDIGCGPALQLRELAKRGYETVGLDRSSEMLTYLEERAMEEGTDIETVEANMTDFVLKEAVDFAFIMMGTIALIGSREEFLSHLNSVAKVLRKGGLYLIENMKLNWASDDFLGSESWIMEKDGVRVKTTYTVELKDALTQKLLEKIKLEVDNEGKHMVFKEKA